MKATLSVEALIFKITIQSYGNIPEVYDNLKIEKVLKFKIQSERSKNFKFIW